MFALVAPQTAREVRAVAHGIARSLEEARDCVDAKSYDRRVALEVAYGELLLRARALETKHTITVDDHDELERLQQEAHELRVRCTEH